MDANADVDAAAASRLELFVVDMANLEEQNERLAKELEDMRADREKWKVLAEASRTAETADSDGGGLPGPPPPTLRDSGLPQGSLEEIENLGSTVYGQSQTNKDLIAHSPDSHTEMPRFAQEPGTILPEVQAGPQYYHSGSALHFKVGIRAHIEDNASAHQYSEPYRGVSLGYTDSSGRNSLILYNHRE